MPHVVIARSVLAAQLSLQGRQNGAGGEGKEPAVRDRVHAAAPGVIGLDLNAMRQPLVGRQLETVVVAVRAGVQLRNRAETRVHRLAIREGRETSLADG